MIPKSSKIPKMANTSIRKEKVSQEMQDNNLLINNEQYTKNFVNININLENNKHIGSVKTKYKTPGKASRPVIPPFSKGNIKLKTDDISKKNQKNNIPKNNSINNASTTKKTLSKKNNTSNILSNVDKDINIDEPFYSQISIINEPSTNKSLNGPKDRIKTMVNKLENIYKEALNNSQKIKTDTLPFNINYNHKDMIDILLEEIKYLKIKNELFKLKSNFQEIVFYSIKELIEDTKRDVSFNQELSGYINNLHNKILCILTQNNQKFYEHLKILDNENDSEVLFAFNLREDDILDKLNQKNISVLDNIEDNIHKIIKDIDDLVLNDNQNFIKNYNNEINSDYMLKINTFKLHLLMASNNIISLLNQLT